MVLDGTAERVLVARVVPGGPAASAGIRPGDAIVAIEGVAVAPGATVAAVARGIRGPVGSPLRLDVRNTVEQQPDGAKTRSIVVVRAAMASLFPSRVEQPLLVQPGVALIASAAQHTVGVLFTAATGPQSVVHYAWAMAPHGQPLAAAGAEHGEGAILWSAAGATIQIAEWRLDLAPWTERGALVAAASSLPVTPSDAASWKSLDPAAPRYVTLRPPPKVTQHNWPAGPCKLAIHAAIGPLPMAGRRMTVELRDERNTTMSAATERTDAKGVATLSLPAGVWTVVALHPSPGGGHRDLAFEAQLTGPVTTALRCDAGAAAAIELPLAALTEPPVAPLPATALNHTLVGKPLPAVTVRRWLGDGAAAPSQRGAMLLYVFATWCGPCKRTSPEVAEIAARLAGEDIAFVVASVDRDEAAIEDYVSALPRGGPAYAWSGPDLLETLDARGIPTMIAVDGAGVVRAVHTGTGVGVASWTTFLHSIAEKSAPEPKAKKKRSN